MAIENVTAEKIRSRKTLHEEVVVSIRDMIVAGELEPGQKVPEAALCEALQISRTPLREALKVLAHEGMLELLPQRGARVAMVSEQEILEIFPILASLEALAGELAAQVITDGQIANISTLHDAMVEAYQRQNRQEYARFNRSIHYAIFTVADNHVLFGLYQGLELKIRNIRHTARKSPAEWQAAVADHEEIMAALRLRDQKRISLVMRQHIMNTARSVQSSLKDISAATTN